MLNHHMDVDLWSWTWSLDDSSDLVELSQPLSSIQILIFRRISLGAFFRADLKLHEFTVWSVWYICIYIYILKNLVRRLLADFLMGFHAKRVMVDVSRFHMFFPCSFVGRDELMSLTIPCPPLWSLWSSLIAAVFFAAATEGLCLHGTCHVCFAGDVSWKVQIGAKSWLKPILYCNIGEGNSCYRDNCRYYQGQRWSD